MLSYRIMKQADNHDLNAFSSWILGFIGAALVLIPSELKIVTGMEHNPLIGVLGLLAFGLALSLQIISILNSQNMRSIAIKASAAAMLFIIAAIYWRACYYLEGIVLFSAGFVVLTLISPLNKYLQQTNILNLTLVLIGFSGGIFLAVTSTLYVQYDLVNYKTFLVIGFLVTAMAGGIATVLPSFRYSNLLSRLHIIPWLGWCFIFIQVAPLATVLIPFLVILAILSYGIVPWSYLNLAKGDTLGRRSMMIAASLEMILLLFLWVLLLLLGNTFGEKIQSLENIRIAAFIFFSLTTLVVHYEVFSILMTINGLIHELRKTEEEGTAPRSLDFGSWGKSVSVYIKPFILTQELVRIRINAQTDQIETLTHKLEKEKKRNAQLTLLLELSQQLENQLDQPVSAQLAVNTLERALDCSLVCIYLYESEKKELMLLAAAGQQTSLVPVGYRQNISEGAIGRAIRQRKTQIINDIREDTDYIRFENEGSD